MKRPVAAMILAASIALGFHVWVLLVRDYGPYDPCYAEVRGTIAYQDCRARQPFEYPDERRLRKLEPYVLVLSAALFGVGLVSTGRFRRWAGSPPRLGRLLGPAGAAKILIALYAVGLSGVALFPPWIRTMQKAGMSQATTPLPHRFILDPPRGEIDDGLMWGVRLDVGRIALELLVLSVIAGALFFLTRSGRRVQTVREATGATVVRRGQPSVSVLAQTVDGTRRAGTSSDEGGGDCAPPRNPLVERGRLADVGTESRRSEVPGPARDLVADYLLELALAGSLPVYRARIPTRLLEQFDEDYSPEDHLDGRKEVDRICEQLVDGHEPTLWVYPRRLTYVLPFDYAEFTAALKVEQDLVNCWVLGSKKLAGVIRFDGPIDPAMLRRVLRKEE